MADIARRPFVSHLRGAATTYVRHQRSGRVAHEGIGTSFWFRPLSAVLSEVPVDDRELPLLFPARTADHQVVTVQATLTYRVVDPVTASVRMDWGIDPSSGRWRGAPLDQLAALLTELAQQHAADLLVRTPLVEALTIGVPAVRERVAAGLDADQRLSGAGVAVVGVRVVAIRAEPDVERALQTPAREEVQQAADRATYDRRAQAVDSERAIAENELANQIELARREEHLVAQRGANERRRAEETAAAAAVEADARAARDRLAGAVEAEVAREVGAARADADRARVAAHAHADPAVLLALAVGELAGHLPAIGTLNLTPDVLTPVLSRLAAPRG